MWLMEQTAYNDLVNARTAKIDAGGAEYVSGGDMVTEGGTATIYINGVLTPQRDVVAAMFGGGNTTYKDIIEGIHRANASRSISQIVLDVGYSPGGNITGLINAMDTIAKSKKPVHAYVRDGALSAAYGLVSQAKTITARDRATQLGSIGVAVDARLDQSVVSITNTDSPDKRPDITTEKGKSKIRDNLDLIFSVFSDSISSGRRVPVERVRSGFGRGSILLAETALAAGMIDNIGPLANNSGQEEIKAMDLNQFAAEYPDVYAAAVKLGAAQERDRVSAHLKLGKASGDMDTAMQAIADGIGLTESIQASYLAASINRKAVEARDADNLNVSAKVVTNESSKIETIVERTLSLLGVDNG